MNQEELHSINERVWGPDASEFQLRADGGDYFSGEPRANRDFPASGLEQAAAAGSPALRELGRQWTLGDAVTSLSGVGLRLDRLEGHPEQYWPLYRHIPETMVNKLPHTFSLLMRKARPD